MSAIAFDAKRRAPVLPEEETGAERAMPSASRGTASVSSPANAMLPFTRHLAPSTQHPGKAS